MYGAMRERASGSTRMAGGATALTITTALGLAVVIGMGGHALIEKEEKLMFTVMPEQTVTPPPDTTRDFDMTEETTLNVVRPIDINIVFDVEDTDTRIITRTDPPPNEGEGTKVFVAPTPPKPPGVRTAARIIPGAAPPYPSSDIRRGNEGISKIEVCLDARGRVTSAQLAKTSGSVSLDKAALEWVREAKFTPAKLDGVAQAVCGHSVDYEWKLDRR